MNEIIILNTPQLCCDSNTIRNLENAGRGATDSTYTQELAPIG